MCVCECVWGVCDVTVTYLVHAVVISAPMLPPVNLVKPSCAGRSLSHRAASEVLHVSNQDEQLGWRSFGASLYLDLPIKCEMVRSVGFRLN